MKNRIDHLRRILKKITIWFLAISLTACGGDFTVDTTAPNRFVHVIESPHVDEARRITVTLPKGYDEDNTRTYPVLFHVAFDQESYDWTISEVEELNTEGSVPELIIVSFDHRSASSSDFEPALSESGGAVKVDKFLAHIEEAVIPLLRQEYRVGDDLILTGWSRFGRFTNYALSAAPGLFSGYIVRSSAPNDDDLHPAILKGLEQVSDMQAGYHMSIGTEGNEASRRPIFDQLAQLLSVSAPTGLTWKSETIKGAGHAETFRPGLAAGLKFYFEKIKKPADTDEPDNGDIRSSTSQQ